MFDYWIQGQGIEPEQPLQRRPRRARLGGLAGLELGEAGRALFGRGIPVVLKPTGIAEQLASVGATSGTETARGRRILGRARGVALAAAARQKWSRIRLRPTTMTNLQPSENTQILRQIPRSSSSGSSAASPRPGFTHWVSFAGQGNYADPELNINGRRVHASGHLTDLLVGYADDFVRTAARGSRSFMLYLSHKAVHEPGDPPRRHRGTYNGARVECSPGCDDTLAGKPALTREVPGTVPPRPGGGPTDPNIRGRHRRLLAVDDGVGRLRRTLEEEGILDETMIVFTSDNGYFHREHAIGDTRWAYDESLRIPFIVHYPPRIRSNTKIGLLVLNIDLAPTLLELAGAPIADDVHGRSLLPLFRDDAPNWRGEFVAEYFPEAAKPRVPGWEAIRSGRWKYIRYPELGREFDELYNLVNDTYELMNLAFDPSKADMRESLSRRLQAGFENLEP